MPTMEGYLQAGAPLKETEGGGSGGIGEAMRGVHSGDSCRLESL